MNYKSRDRSKMSHISAGQATITDSLCRTLSVTIDGVLALQAMSKADSELTKSFTTAAELIQKSSGRIIVTGIGKSGHIGRKLAATLASTGSPAYFLHATEASHGDLGMVGADDIIIALSWSGETVELTNTLNYAKRFSVPLIAITSVADSALAQYASAAIVLPNVAEACPHGLAPTTSALLQLAIGDALAIAVLELKGFSVDDFKDLHPGGKLGARLRHAAEFAHADAKMPLIGEDAMMAEAIVEMSSKGFGAVGVIDRDDALIGIITDGDLRRQMNDSLLQQPVQSIMSRQPKTVDSATLASEALHIMQASKIGILFVIEAKKPTGILHMQDLLRAGVT